MLDADIALGLRVAMAGLGLGLVIAWLHHYGRQRPGTFDSLWHLSVGAGLSGAVTSLWGDLAGAWQLLKLPSVSSEAVKQGVGVATLVVVAGTVEDAVRGVLSALRPYARCWFKWALWPRLGMRLRRR